MNPYHYQTLESFQSKGFNTSYPAITRGNAVFHTKKVCQIGDHPLVLETRNGVKVGKVKILAGTKRSSANFIAPNENPCLVAAKSLITGTDYMDEVEIATHDGMLYVAITTQEPFMFDDIIQVSFA